MRAPLILILAALVALGLQLSLGLGSAPPPDAAVRLRRAKLQPTPTPQPLVRAPVVLAGERSPFDTLRAGPAEASSDTYSLVGVVLSGASASAIVRDPAGASHVLRPGDTLQGWTLESVSRDDAALARGTDRRTLTLNGPSTVLNRTPS